MPQLIQNIETELVRYPKLLAYFKSEPPNPSLLDGAQNDISRIYKPLIPTKPRKRDLTLVQLCCFYGKHSHIETLELTNPAIKNTVRADDYLAIRVAAQNGHTDTIKYLETHLSPGEIKEAVKARNYLAIPLTADYGHTDTIRHLETHLSPDEIKEAAKADNYLAIRRAALNGHTDTIKYLLTHLSRGFLFFKNERKAAVKACNYEAIQEAAENGHTDTIQYLETHLSPGEIKKAVKESDYYAIRRAALYGHTDTLQYLETHLSPDEIKEATKAAGYYTIKWAVREGHTETIQYLETHLNPDEIKEAVKESDYYTIKWAAENGHTDTVHHFLNNGIGLTYAESHDREYGQQYVYPFVRNKLTSLQEQKAEFEQNNPNGVFDVNEDKARLCFYMLRNLIRRGVVRDHPPLAEDLRDEIRFLLNIPSVRALCHQMMSPEGGENELLRFAIRIGNEDAIGLLLQTPEVRRLAEQHDFYRNEARNGLDLNQIAQDRESSMVALSVAERKVVEKVKAHYQGKIDALGGGLEVFEALKAELKERYEANPATIEVVDRYGRKQEVKLPFSWDDFQALKSRLTDEQYKLALKAYFQHDAHTTYRYLSKPNYWMADDASYVYVYHDEQGQQTPYRYSTFEDYKSLISLFYIAVFDNDAPALDGYTIEGRVELFIKQLALIGRAHNWDKLRDVKVGDEIKLDNEGKPVTEEYDDLAGDKPSCYSGVNRRLFQSVLGHGLFKAVSLSIIKQAMNEQVQVFFENAITQANCASLQKAYQDLIEAEGDAQQHLQCLSSIDIPDERKLEMIKNVSEQLENEYKSQFTDDKTHFITQMTRYLSGAKVAGCDLLYFQATLSLDALLNKRASERPGNMGSKPSSTSKRISQHDSSFFASSPGSRDAPKEAPLPAPANYKK